MPITRDELRTVDVFHDLPDDQLDWFLEHASESDLRAGEVYVHSGDPADRMVVVIDGELQASDRRPPTKLCLPRRPAACREVCRIRA